MEMTKPEVAAILKIQENVKELTELELALVGGGVGDVILG